MAQFSNCAIAAIARYAAAEHTPPRGRGECGVRVEFGGARTSPAVPPPAGPAGGARQRHRVTVRVPPHAA
jgi:hypothetical protein